MFKGHATALLPSMLAITVLILAAIICPGHDNHVLITLQVCATPAASHAHRSWTWLLRLCQTLLFTASHRVSDKNPNFLMRDYGPHVHYPS